jgi:hypothetical protein
MKYSKVLNEDFARISINDLLENPKSKEEVFRGKLNKTFDFTLPQNFVNSMKLNNPLIEGFLVSTTVWVYEPGDNFGFPVSCCIEVQNFLEENYFKSEEGK